MDSSIEFMWQEGTKAVRFMSSKVIGSVCSHKPYV